MYVPVLFVTEAAVSAPPSTSRFQRLVGFVQRLIDYGKELAAAFQRGEIPLDPADPGSAAHRFGTRDLRIVLARIARGLLLAEALQARLTRRGDPSEAPPRAAAAPRSETRAPRERAPRPETDREPDPDNLPTAEMIAEAIRHRPVGAVLADICRDFGITPPHPAWREMFEFIICYGGQLVPLFKDTAARLSRVPPPVPPADVPLGIWPVCTGPPWPPAIAA